MMNSDLRETLNRLELSQADFARLISVTPRAVNLWVSGNREVPGPVEAYVRLLESLPLGTRQTEFSKLLGKDSPMREGMYGIAYQDSSGDSGTGVLVFEAGRIFGADGGARYDGEYVYNEATGLVDIQLKVTFGPGVMSVFGVVNPYEWAIDITTTLDPKLDSGNLIVRTSIGRELGAHYDYLRPLPQAA